MRLESPPVDIEKSNEEREQQKKKKGKDVKSLMDRDVSYRRRQPSSHTIYLHSSCRSTETHIYTERKKIRDESVCMAGQGGRQSKISQNVETDSVWLADKIKYAKLNQPIEYLRIFR
jgi:hypothetical protein